MRDDVAHLADLVQGSADAPWLWLLIFSVAGLDALLPFMPSETTVLTVAVVLGPVTGELRHDKRLEQSGTVLANVCHRTLRTHMGRRSHGHPVESGSPAVGVAGVFALATPPRVERGLLAPRRERV